MNPMRALVTLSLRRPVTVAAVAIGVVMLGAVAAVRLPVALLPDLRYPALAVWTAYENVPPERVERSVTIPVEAAVAGTQGVEDLASRSLLGGSLVHLRFGWNTDLDLALLDVREQLDGLGRALPEGADRPLVLRIDPSDRPIMLVALSEQVKETSTHGSESYQDLIALRTLASEVVARRLEQLPDVARVRVTGGYDARVVVRFDPDQLAAYSLDLSQVSSALRNANVSHAGGLVHQGPLRYAVEVSGEFTSVEEVGETVISGAGRVPIRLRQVASVQMGHAEAHGRVRYDGRETLLLLVERRPGANTVRAAEGVREALGALGREMPRLRLDIVRDESVFVAQAISGVTQAVGLGGLLAVLVLFVFLRHPRALAAVTIAIPLSLLATLAAFDALGVSLNLIALSGLALGVGMLVDNAIVVVENIARLQSEGMTRREAAERGTHEVAGAIAASTLTTIAVFAPIMFVEGLAGRLFRDQSLAVICSLVASLVVALTVVPLVAAGGSAVQREKRSRSHKRGWRRAATRLQTGSALEPTSPRGSSAGERRFPRYRRARSGALAAQRAAGGQPAAPRRAPGPAAGDGPGLGRRALRHVRAPRPRRPARRAHSVRSRRARRSPPRLEPAQRTRGRSADPSAAGLHRRRGRKRASRHSSPQTPR